MPFGSYSTTATTQACTPGTICASWRPRRPPSDRQRAPGPDLKPAKHGPGDFALEALQRLSDGLDISDFGPVAVPEQDGRPDPRRDDIGICTIQRRGRVVDHDAIVALGVLREVEEFLGAEQLLWVGRRGAGHQQRKAWHNVDRS